MNASETKPAYIKPEITKIGEFEDITRGGTSGGYLDATFSVGTPVDELTFS